jgi:Papain family cysteine protease
VDTAFEYIKDNRGVDVDFYYPYHDREQRCMFDPTSVGAVVTGYVDVEKGDEDALKLAVATQGPISVIIDSSHNSFAVGAGIQLSALNFNSLVFIDSSCTSPVYTTRRTAPPRRWIMPFWLSATVCLLYQTASCPTISPLGTAFRDGLAAWGLLAGEEQLEREVGRGRLHPHVPQ